ncbi:multicopper oxidase type 3 [Haloterrigena turkmenica DSM 5511]|uniref:Multicopper oxidase type 3 n=1 Tax=Haloterrigena turkmenica (strain ATCC 51198 / DSM 5511 / JCM 9101 / NCIMB 13204 / VKM B-1734 / 4k) TaxID=543526 RepID=D2RR59_HALTV|nr:multicopper oxidase domain-containing protein [Haloterrigena turkmenica]ADB62455.1 multicopper oxidase type 3 [Haloterrigena turkmenica DSM 5511]
MAGTGALGALAGCLSGLSSDGATATEPDNESDADEDGKPLTDYEYTAPPQIVDLAEQDHKSTLRTVSARHQLVSDEAKGGPVELPEVWAWQADDLAPSVPGPIYRMQEGETFELTFENDHGYPHTVHVHAVGKSWKDDGAPVTTQTQINPGNSKTYVLEGDVPGTHFYHCHVQTHNHLDMGMYGIIRVDPEGYEAPDREYFLTLREWDSRLHEQTAGGDAEYDVSDRRPNFYTVNGRSAPTTFHPELGSPLIMSEGETVRIHVVNAGYETHAFHTHGHRFTVVEEEGSPIPEAARYEQDVVPIAPAERLTLEFEADADPGLYPVHCHKVDHVTTDGRYPGGMATAIVYEEAMDTEEFADVMDDAGYEG